MKDKMAKITDKNKIAEPAGTRNGLLKIQVLILLILFISLNIANTCLAQNNITITNIWYKKVPNFTRVTIKADNGGAS